MSNALEPLTPENPEPRAPLPPPQTIKPGPAVPQAPAQSAPEPEPQAGFQDQMSPIGESSTGGEALHTGELEGGVTASGWDTFVRRLKASSGESGGISGIGTAMGGEPGALTRMAEEEYLRLTKTQDDPLIDPKTLTETYGIPFTEPEFGDVAALRAASVMRQRELQDAISRGPSAGMTENFAVGMAAMLTDPASMATMAATGAVGGALGSAGLGTLGKLAATGAENLAVGGALALPHYTQENIEGNKVTVGQELTGAFEGALYGTALHYGVFKPLAFAVEKATPFAKQMSKALRDKLTLQTVALHEMDMKTDTSNVEGAMEARNAGMQPPGSPPPGSPPPPPPPPAGAAPQGRVFYEAISGDTGAPVPPDVLPLHLPNSAVKDESGQPLTVYHGTGVNGGGVLDEKFLSGEGYVGPGHYFTENPKIASKYASKGQGIFGNVHANLQAIAEYQRAKVVEFLEKEGLTEIPLYKNLNDPKPGGPYFKLSADEPVHFLRTEFDPDYRREGSKLKSGDEGFKSRLNRILNTLPEESRRNVNSRVNAGNVLIAHLNITKPLDVDQTLTQGVADRLKTHWDGKNPYNEKWGQKIQAELDTHVGKLSVRDALREVLGYTESDTPQSLGGDFTQVIQEAGYDGVTHEGGVLGGEKHRVWVAFDNKQIFSKFDPERIATRDLTDNGARANSLASDPEGGRNGEVRAVRIPDNAKLLKLDEKPTRDVLAQAKADGYDGVHYEFSANGKSGNIVALFDGDKFPAEETFSANPDLTPKVEPYQLPDKLTDENSRNSSPEVLADIEKYKNAKPVQNDSEKLAAHLKAQDTEAMKKLSKLAEEDPELKKQLDDMRRKKADDAKELAVLKEFSECDE